mmetsp:Transcript_68784/g.201446  ORF Transcript_68784/g.201446 Transcript_68784/m.201446 type:complete len:371 (+) Transcript_68784:56-1168(+)
MSVTDSEAWRNPPPGPIDVAVRFNLNKLTDVDTVRSKAWVSIGIMFYWTDSRLEGWTGNLPPTLWGPACWLFNALTDLVEVTQDFDLDDASTGRMKRYCRYMGTIDFKQMQLQDFPMDVNAINLTFRTASHWTSLDGKKGDLARGRSYKLVPVSRAHEGSTFRLLWGGQLQELTLLGVSMEISELPPSKSGQEVTTLTVCFHVSRNVPYYIWKVLMPIYLLTLLTFCVFAMEVRDVADRLSAVITLFLASFAMLYVVEHHLPKTNFLTVVDKVIVMNSVLLVSVGCIIVFLIRVHNTAGEERADLLNLWSACTLGAIYFSSNAVILVPTCRRKRRRIEDIVGKGRKGQPQPSDASVKDHIFMPLESISKR